MRGLCLFFTFFLAFTLCGQDTLQYRIDMTGGANLNGGNAPFYGGNFKLTSLFEKGQWDAGVSPSLLLNWAAIDNKIQLLRREVYSSITINYHTSTSWRLLLFTEAEHSYIRKIGLRYTGGGGVGYTWPFQQGSLHISGVLLPEGLLTNGQSTADYFVLRASFRARLLISCKRLSGSSVTTIQPAVYANQGLLLRDHAIARSQNRCELSFSKTAKVGASLDIGYQAYPTRLSPLIRPLDWTTSVFFQWTFRK